MRTQGEAEVAIEQGETRFEGVRWVTPHQIAANQVIPLPEPARRGLVNAATDVAAATGQAVAAAAHLRPTEHAPRAGGDGARRVGRAATNREIPVIIPTEEDHHDEPNHIGSQWRPTPVAIHEHGSPTLRLRRYLPALSGARYRPRQSTADSSSDLPGRTLARRRVSTQELPTFDSL
jgi:hypothetical protein